MAGVPAAPLYETEPPQSGRLRSFWGVLLVIAHVPAMWIGHLIASAPIWPLFGELPSEADVRKAVVGVGAVALAVVASLAVIAWRARITLVRRVAQVMVALAVLYGIYAVWSTAGVRTEYNG